MSALLSRCLSLIFNSDPAGAENVSADGSSFQVTLHDPVIPKDAVECKIGHRRECLEYES